ncbi:alginate lyase family protein [Paenibacillus sp. GCM10027627]|uniref:alginate lyase family protein n=1 Tax=unclassified Paenibacillus TaxID=185978 RepID=UPI00363A0776
MSKHISKNENSPRFFWSPESRDFIAKACLQRWPEEAAEVMRRAELAASGTFVFTSRWDMEPCPEEISFASGMDWGYVHKGDAEWTYMLNRMGYMKDLGQAYWLTGDENYARAYISLLRDWCKHNTLGHEEMEASKEQGFHINSRWRRIDASLRFTNWLKGYACVSTSDAWQAEREELEPLLAGQAERHGAFLSMAYNAFDIQSNWGFISANGLYQIGMMYPSLAEAESWKATAVKRMEEMAASQLPSDGFHSEQSPQYHHEVLHHLFEAALLGKLNGSMLPAFLLNKLERMLDASVAIATPSRRQPMLSDSDDVDVRDKWCQGALLFGRNDLKGLSYDELDYDSLWYFGAEGAALYSSLTGELPSYTSTSLQTSGLMIMRSGWGRDDHYLLMDGGHLATSGHGHDDLLHIELHGGGREFLIDTGRYTYKEGEERQYFKPSLQHNTLSVDGLAATAYIDTWTWGRPAVPTNAQFISNHAYDYAEAGHDGYWGLDSPVAVSRQVIYIKDDYWILVDTFCSSGEHRYGAHFHFAEHTPLLHKKDKGLIVTAFDHGTNLFLLAAGSASAIKEEKCWISRHYNEKTLSRKIIVGAESEAEGAYTTLITVLGFFTGSKQPDIAVLPLEVCWKNEHRLPPERAIGFAVKRGDGATDNVVISRQGPQSYQFAGHQMTGEVLWVREREGMEDQACVMK